MPTRGENFIAGGSPWNSFGAVDAGIHQAAANRLAVDVQRAERAAGIQRRDRTPR